MTFSHTIFWQHPLSTLCFFALAMSFVSLWIRKSVWIWGSFLVIAYGLAWQSNIVQWISLIPILTLLICHEILKKDVPRAARFLLFCVAIGVSLALAFHFLPGFNNWQIASQLCISPGAYPYNLWLNFDKPFIGLFVLAFALPLIDSRARLFQVLKVAIPFSIIGILLMIWISVHFNLVLWNPKIPMITLIWLIDNLIFVSIPEEAFFRGFIQRELYQWFGKTQASALGSIFLTSIFFTLLHLIWVSNLGFLSLVFVASLIYGAIYQATESIEASILCHFGLNVAHFFLFTYPALV